MVGADAASPQPTVPSSASIRTRMLNALLTVDARHGDGLGERQSDRDRIDPADDQRGAFPDLTSHVRARFHGFVSLVHGEGVVALPRMCGNWMNSHGDGIGPTGTSIKVGPSRRLNARLSAARSSFGLRARSASAPKLSA